jgi:hypothetical protein
VVAPRHCLCRLYLLSGPVVCFGVPDLFSTCPLGVPLPNTYPSAFFSQPPCDSDSDAVLICEFETLGSIASICLSLLGRLSRFLISLKY